MVWLIDIGVTVHEISRVEILKKLLSQKKITKLCIFKGQYLANGRSEFNNP